MSLVKLTQDDRFKLSSLVAKTVDCPVELEAWKVARKKVIKLANVAQAKQFPKEAMAVLSEFDCTHSVTELALNVIDTEKEGHEVFDYYRVPCDPTIHPITFATELGIAPSQCIETDMDSELHEAAIEFGDLECDHTNALRRAAEDYNKMIKSAISFEDVVKVWPEAEQLRDKMERSRHNPNSDSRVIDRVKLNVQARLDAAK